MNIILDINIFLGAYIWVRVTLTKLVSCCLQGDFSLLMGAALLAKYEDVLVSVDI